MLCDLSRKDSRNVNALLFVGFLKISVAKYLCVIARFCAVLGLVWLSLQMRKVLRGATNKNEKREKNLTGNDLFTHERKHVNKTCNSHQTARLLWHILGVDRF